MLQHRRRHLGQVHVAAAAQTDQAVGFEPAGMRDARLGHSQRGLRFATGEHVELRRVAQRRSHLAANARVDQPRVGDDQNPPQAQAAGDRAELCDRARAKDDLSGRSERPRRAHEKIRPMEMSRWLVCC